jgi:hypothetical protein
MRFVPDVWEHLVHGQQRDLDELVASRLDLGLRLNRVGSEDVSAVSAASFPRRQQAYRLKRPAGAGAGAVAITAAGLTAGLAGLTAAAVVAPADRGCIGPVRASLRAAGRPKPDRGTLGGRGAAGTRNARVRGLAAAPLNRLAARWGHRPRRDRTDRRRVRDRDQDPHLTTRSTSPRSTSRRPGCAVIAGAGARTARYQSSASRAGASSRSNTTSSWCPSIAS